MYDKLREPVRFIPCRRRGYRSHQRCASGSNRGVEIHSGPSVFLLKNISRPHGCRQRASLKSSPAADVVKIGKRDAGSGHQTRQPSCRERRTAGCSESARPASFRPIGGCGRTAPHSRHGLGVEIFGLAAGPTRSTVAVFPCRPYLRQCAGTVHAYAASEDFRGAPSGVRRRRLPHGIPTVQKSIARLGRSRPLANICWRGGKTDS